MDRESLTEKAAYFLADGRGFGACLSGSIATGFLLGVYSIN